jgi:NAD(P)-dependent dehydrogenase (short-subunit alcohol dehydrogenase family)
MERRQFLEVSTGAALLSAAYSSTRAFGQQEQSNKEVVLITGTSSGFGRSMALTFARAGYSVIATMREPDQRNLKNKLFLLELARAEGLLLRVEELDVNSQAQTAALLDGIKNRENRIDILVNNAGIIVYTPTEIAPPSLWTYQMQTNLYAPLNLTRMVLPFMRDRGKGLVIMISSRVGRVVVPGLGLYCASKFALETATEAMHYETTPQGIDFAILQPSAFDTDVNRNARRIYSSFSRPILERESPRGTEFYSNFLNRLDRNFAGQPTRPPQELATLALQIANLSSRERTLRYPIGDSWEIDPVRTLNRQVSAMQEAALRSGGYGDLWRD